MEVFYITPKVSVEYTDTMIRVSQNSHIRAGKISVVFFTGGFTLTFSVGSEGLVNPEMQSETWECACRSSHIDFYEWKLSSSSYQCTHVLDVTLPSPKLWLFVFGNIYLK